MLVRFWRNWRGKRRLLSRTERMPLGWFYSKSLGFPELKDKGTDRLELPAYDGLAAVWNEYARAFASDYTAYLPALTSIHKLKLNAVLDLACGAGLHTAQLAALAKEVVGLDVSEPMLDRARAHCSSLPNVRFVQGDFCNFKLRQQFDAIVCANNSLNYVRGADALAAVFRCAAEHLRPGGVFVFDTVTEYGMQALLGERLLHVAMEGQRFVLHFRYDSKRRQEQALALLPSGTETHIRVPIDPEDVKQAARGSGLVLHDYFSHALLPGWLFLHAACYFVLKRQGQKVVTTT